MISSFYCFTTTTIITNSKVNFFNFSNFIIFAIDKIMLIFFGFLLFSNIPYLTAHFSGNYLSGPFKGDPGHDPTGFFLKQKARWPTGPRGPKGQKGDPGERECYENDEYFGGICNNKKYLLGAKLSITPSVVNNTICGTTVAIRGPCFHEKSKITCIFHDLVKGPIQGEGFAKIENGIPTAFCVVPFLQDTGRITVDVIVGLPNSTINMGYSGYLWVIMPSFDVTAAFMNCETNSELHVSWPTTNPAVSGAERVDIGMHAFDLSRKIWINLGILGSLVPNTGSARIDISKFRTMITECAVIVSVRRPLKILDVKSALMAADCGGSLVSSLVHRVTSCDVPGFCSSWFRGDIGIARSENPLPCPASLSQAIVDTNFIEDNSEKVKLLRHFLPDASIFRSRFGTSNGVGQQCIYDSLTGNMISGSADRGSSANRYNPDGFLRRTLHFLFDVVPFVACCYGTNDECQLFYERRAISNKPYIPPHACAIWGDPHITTCDVLTYHFQGVGEFWLLKSYLPDGTVFFGQVRMEQWPTHKGVSVSTAFALKDGHSSTVMVKPARKDSRLEILADGHRVPIEEDTILSQSFRGFSIAERSDDMTSVSIAFSSGITFKASIFTVGPKRFKYLSLTVFVSSLHRGSLKGLLGNFDGKPENDFVTSDGTVIPSLPQKQSDGHLESGVNLAVIHWSFGMKWAIANSESLFSYPCGLSSREYFDPSFVPNVAMPDADEAPPECNQVCGPSDSCLFDCVNVDIYFANVTAYMEVVFADTVKKLLQNVQGCPLMMSPDNGFMTGPYGGVANFGCDMGYTLIGPSAITCFNGTWRQPPPVCIRSAPGIIECPPVEHPEHGQIMSTDATSVTFSCDSGYVLEGSPTLTCVENTWSSPAPVCIPLHSSLHKHARPVSANMKLPKRDDNNAIIPLSSIDQLMSGVDVDVDVNVNFNLPNGFKLTGINKHQHSARRQA